MYACMYHDCMYVCMYVWMYVCLLFVCCRHVVFYVVLYCIVLQERMREMSMYSANSPEPDQSSLRPFLKELGQLGLGTIKQNMRVHSSLGFRV